MVEGNKSMKYKINYDKESTIVKIEFYRNLEDNDVASFSKDIELVLKGRSCVGAILDHGTLLDKGMPKMSREARKEFGEIARRSGVKKLAMVAVPAIVKTISQTIGFLAKGDDVKTRFFKTEPEALRWLKGGK
jgi:hypothetical protein